jgi:CBS domain-containing protein
LNLEKKTLFAQISLIVMDQIRDIMQTNVITIDHEKNALDAVKLLTEKKISFLVIQKDGNPIGVVTERDIVQKISYFDEKTSEFLLKDIMSTEFKWVGPNEEIENAIQKMLNNNIRRLLVLENEKLLGIITLTDLAGFLRRKLLISGTLKKIESD